MESVASMDAADQQVMSENFGAEPWQCDAGTMSWCSRPRLYWLSWELHEQEGATFTAGSGSAPRSVCLVASQDLEEVCSEGWIKTDPSRSFPTFTTSRPREKPGHKPAGVATCSAEDLDRWVNDSFRYPPYQYTAKNLLINKRNEMRLPTIEEKEYMMGFPVGYTQCCVPKRGRGTLEHSDARQSHWEFLERPSRGLVGGAAGSSPGVNTLVYSPTNHGLCQPYPPNLFAITAVAHTSPSHARAGACV